jgi:acetyl-CoA acetyltransferase
VKQLANELRDRAAIVGIGETEFSKNSGRSELRLALEAVTAALTDAGLEPRDVDGYATFSMDNNPAIEINRSIGGGDLRFFSRVHYGGGAACATVLQAAMAVATGVADTVVCYRAMNERSMQRFGAGVQERPPTPTVESAHFGWYAPYGLLTPASWVAMCARPSAACPSPTASTRPPTPPPGSTRSPSRSKTTRIRAGSSTRCGCSTAARRATARWRWW